MNNIKIPCIVLVYYDKKIIEKSIQFLLKANRFIDIIVLENKSVNTEKIKPYLMELVKKKQIYMYVEFDENISNNAVEEFFDSRIINIHKCDKIIVTDGDLQGNSNDWFYEERDILKRRKEVFACGINLKTNNLPIQHFREAKNWIPKSRRILNDCEECATGNQLLMMRSKEFKGFLRYMKRNKLKFKDSEMLKYCYDVLGRIWVKTKKNKVKHLTWDLYSNLSNSYTRYKLSKSHKQHWYHNKYCDFTVYCFNGSKKITYK
ncbi:hypothetical protein BJV85_001536 [Clostridium acetobutylicum]|uniref:Glycosyltransferase n=1 Tax=Clostridium acetobutylicum (strain ATCC 824 / DSM 792 / JCM 1419 / IAM 19013 / LMG 5710 / NBRC 13948 / NRRL B-527 / VKM B-1787 / 2291 / W) TaxID=272562 RepID=Q97GL7_CLOAB|nr:MULTISPECIES: hypothetical protein [Clostridium]AAK80305.1 Hypothetical protein CA_C2349 [Clostridium acetobutylicum ATCC 824]AEI32296.1 hypothetical protein SMB_G2383 [Clostridium acetobutylicum DSM 1731]AWV79274.1 hypothetical protein DK921_04015 [Clostridium acetobutylicum]MBC2394757.1 hypothetical protein [Clostridium acetobutylicum]MBC2585716.1 hypothetical protein [Clostridium acetobutylicum]